MRKTIFRIEGSDVSEKVLSPDNQTEKWAFGLLNIPEEQIIAVSAGKAISIEGFTLPEGDEDLKQLKTTVASKMFSIDQVGGLFTNTVTGEKYFQYRGKFYNEKGELVTPSTANLKYQGDSHDGGGGW